MEVSKYCEICKNIYCAKRQPNMDDLKPACYVGIGILKVGNKQMNDRLTYRDDDGKVHIMCRQICGDMGESCDTAYQVDACQKYVAFRKLAAYEDLEEKGLLVRLDNK